MDCRTHGQHRQTENTRELQLANGRWVRIHENRTANGGSIGVRIDITELKLREEELRKQNMMLDAALNNMSQGLVLFDAERRVLVCNKRYREIYGLTPDQVKPGTPTAELIQHRLALGLQVSEPTDYVRGRVDGPVKASIPTSSLRTAAPLPTRCGLCAGRWRRCDPRGCHRAAPHRGAHRPHGAS